MCVSTSVVLNCTFLFVILGKISWLSPTVAYCHVDIVYQCIDGVFWDIQSLLCWHDTMTLASHYPVPSPSWGICYVQSSDWGNLWIVLHKVQIQALHGQFLGCPRVRPCTTNVVHVYVQSFARVRWFVYIGWRMAHCETFEKWTKETFLFGKKFGSKVLLLLNKVTIDFRSRLLCCAFPSSTLYTSPSTIDFWP